MATASALSTTTDPNAVFESLWRDAVDFFNSRLTNDVKKKIDLNASGAGPRATISIIALVDFTNGVKAQYDAQRSPTSKKIAEILKWFDKYAIVVDVMIQHHPDITSLVWGGIRSLLVIAISEIDTSETIASTLCDVLRQIEHWHHYFLLWERSAGLRNTLTELFAQLINFMTRANRFHEGRSVARLGKAAFTNFHAKLKDILKRIDHLARTVESDSQQASHHELVRHVTNMEKEREMQNNFRTAQMKHLRTIEEKQTATLEHIVTLENHKHHHFNESKRLVLSWLNAQITKASLSSWQDGTCDWVLAHESYRRWDRSKSSRPLWIHGKPGCGKSVIANFMSQVAFTSYCQDRILSYYVQKSVSIQTTNVASLLGSVMGQAIQTFFKQGNEAQDSILKEIISLSKAQPTLLQCSVTKLLPVFGRIIRNVAPVILIIDGIDECDQTSDIANLLVDLTTLSSLEGVRIIILSRYHPTYREFLGDGPTLSIAPDQTNTEIQKLIEAEIAQHDELKSLGPALLNKGQQSEGMFLWARMLLESVMHAPTLHDQYQCLNRLPRGLESTYRYFLTMKRARLTSSQATLQLRLFALLLTSARALSIAEINCALALSTRSAAFNEEKLLIQPEHCILDLGSSLLNIVGDRVELLHASLKEYLLTNHDQHPLPGLQSLTSSYITKCCIHQLMLPQVGTRPEIRALLEYNLHTTDVGDVPITLYLNSPSRAFYEYAAQHWHTHVSDLQTPSQQLLESLNEFFSSLQHVAWAETVASWTTFAPSTSLLAIRTCLRTWSDRLPSEFEGILRVDLYVVDAYRNAITHFRSSGNVLDAAMLSSRLGEFYEACPGYDDLQILQALIEADEGFRSTLGPFHSRSLRATRALATAKLVREMPGEAYSIYEEIVRRQMQTLDSNTNQDIWETTSLQGLSALLMNESSRAEVLLQAASRGFLSTSTIKSRPYLHNQLYLGWTLERRGQLYLAKDLYEGVWKTWKELSGPEGPATLMNQGSLAQVLRKLGHYQEAERHYQYALRGRQMEGGWNEVSIDQAIGLCHTYNATQRFEQAFAHLELLFECEALNQSLERKCQAKHVQALLIIEQNQPGAKARAESLLKELLEYASTQRPSINRELLWVRLTLARIYRSDGRLARIPTLFEGLCEPDHELADQTTRNTSMQSHASIAEAALELISSLEEEKAKTLLKKHGLKWAREEAFHILYGGPLTDTAGCHRGISVGAWESASLRVGI